MMPSEDPGAGQAHNGGRPSAEPPWHPPAGPQPSWSQPPWGQPGWQQPSWDRQPFSPAGAANGLPYGQPRYTAPPKPGVVPLRPLMFGEIMDGAFQTIRRNAKAMLGAALLAQSLATILAAVVTAVTATSAGSIEAWADSASPADLSALGMGFIAAILLFSLLTLLMSSVLQGAMVVPVARAVLNRRTGFRRMWALTRPSAGALLRLAALLLAGGLLALLLLGVLAVVLVANMEGTGILLVIPLLLASFALFLWIYIKLLVAPAAVVVEELGAFGGLRRSWRLTRANWWRILGMTLVVSILVGVAGQVVMIPATLLTTTLPAVVSPHGGTGQELAAAVAAGVVTAVLGALVGALGYAFQTSVMALIYMDLRMRKDGLDISLLGLLESGGDPDGVPGRNSAGVPGRPAPGSGPAAGTWPDVR